MTKYNGVIVLAKEAWKTIEWFTRNYDKEIGAYGIGEVKNGELIVEKLVFPEQTVNSVHVHIGVEDMAALVKELDIKEFGKVIFYWHKHPNGSATSSSGDEDDTYDALMDRPHGSKIMGFLVTSLCNGHIEQDCRIEMRKPIISSIPAQTVSMEDVSMEKKCKKIIFEKIEKPALAKEKEKEKAIKLRTNNYNQGTKDQQTFNKNFGFSNLSEKYLNKKGNKKATKLQSNVSAINEILEVYLANGMATICINECIEDYIESFVQSIDFLSCKPVKKYFGKVIRYYLVPKKDSYKDLKEVMKELYRDMETMLDVAEEEEGEEINPSGQNETSSDEEAINTMFNCGSSKGYIN